MLRQKHAVFASCALHWLVGIDSPQKCGASQTEFVLGLRRMEEMRRWRMDDSGVAVSGHPFLSMNP